MAGYWGNRQRLTRRDFVRRCGATVALAFAPAVAACTSRGRSGATTPGAASGPTHGGTLTLRSFSDIATLDYAGSSDAYSGFVQMQCLESLVAFDSRLNLLPLLAQRWESPDALTYVFSLRQGVKFQDGTALDAAAVRYSLIRRLQRVAGDGWSGGKNPLSIDTIEAVDSNTAKVSLAAPLSPFLSTLGGNSTGFWPVISPAVAERFGSDRLGSDLTGAGTGPFSFLEWRHGDSVTLQRNRGYWRTDPIGGPLPYLDRLVVRVIPGDTEALASLRAGEVDAFNPVPSSGPPPKDIAGIKRDPALAYAETPGLDYTCLFFNELRPPGASLEVRQAVAHAIDRSAIAKGVFYDTVTPTDVVLPASIWAAEPDYHPYLKRDPERARQLMAQAGSPKGFAFTLSTRTGSPVFQLTAQLIKDQLREVGIDMSIQQLEFQRLLQAFRSGEDQAGSVGVVGDPDPDGWVRTPFSVHGAQNSSTHYQNAEVEALIAEARTTGDMEERKALYQRIQRLAIDAAALCVLYSSPIMAVSSRKVRNLPLSPLGAARMSEVWKTT